MNKKGLATGIIALVIVLFIVAVMNLITLTMYEGYIGSLQGISNETISQDVKDDIVDATDFMYWGDKLFVMIFIVLLIGYIISSVTVPVDEPIYFLVFLFVLLFTVIISMVISNVWTYMIEQPNLLAAAGNLTFTQFFMNYFPFITFVVGILGAILFYGRKELGGGNSFNNQGLGGANFG